MSKTFEDTLMSHLSTKAFRSLLTRYGVMIDVFSDYVLKQYVESRKHKVYCMR